jgi:hypothetical protein
VTFPPPPDLGEIDLVLHAAAWTDVDGAEADPQGAAAVNVGGTQNVALLGAPLVYFSTDYVFDGRKRTPYLEVDPPNPQSAYGRTKLHGEAAAGDAAWIVRTSWLFGWTGSNFVRTMLRLGADCTVICVGRLIILVPATPFWVQCRSSFASGSPIRTRLDSIIRPLPVLRMRGGYDSRPAFRSSTFRTRLLCPGPAGS